MDMLDDLTTLDNTEATAKHSWRMHTWPGYFRKYLDIQIRKTMPYVDTTGVTPDMIFKLLGPDFSRKMQKGNLLIGPQKK